MGRAMLSKPLIQFSVDGWGCVPSLLFTWGQTMEVRNRWKGLDMIDRMPDELWSEVHDIVQETGSKTIPKKKKCKNKMAD